MASGLDVLIPLGLALLTSGGSNTGHVVSTDADTPSFTDPTDPYAVASVGTGTGQLQGPNTTGYTYTGTYKPTAKKVGGALAGCIGGALVGLKVGAAFKGVGAGPGALIGCGIGAAAGYLAG